jgi:hypothetical protein
MLWNSEGTAGRMEAATMFPMREERLDWQLIASIDPDSLSNIYECIEWLYKYKIQKSVWKTLGTHYGHTYIYNM